MKPLSDAKRAYYAKHVPWHLANMVRFIKRMGAEHTPSGEDMRPQDPLIFKFDTDRDRWHTWAADNLAKACEDILGCADPRLALRSLLQACICQGRVDFLPPHVMDCMQVVKSYVEDVIGDELK